MKRWEWLVDTCDPCPIKFCNTVQLYLFTLESSGRSAYVGNSPLLEPSDIDHLLYFDLLLSGTIEMNVGAQSQHKSLTNH